MEAVISAVLDAHESYGGGCYCTCTPEDADGAREGLGEFWETHLSRHLAAVVLDWLRTQLAAEGMREAVAENLLLSMDGDFLPAAGRGVDNTDQDVPLREARPSEVAWWATTAALEAVAERLAGGER